MTAFGSDNLRLAAFCERDLETLVCARGAKLSLKALSKRLESPPARKPRINLRPTGDGGGLRGSKDAANRSGGSSDRQ